MRIKYRLQQEDGFTLIELMAVLAILTMLVLIAVPAIGSITKKAEAQADDATISMIEKAGGLALLGDVPYDDSDGEKYAVATLVEEGYLDIDESLGYTELGNYVTRVKGHEFEYGNVEKQLEKMNGLLNDPSNWTNRDSNYAWLVDPLDMGLPTGDYMMDVTETMSNASYYMYTLTLYDKDGAVVKAYNDINADVLFTITDDVDSIMIRYRGQRVSTGLKVPDYWFGDKIVINVEPR